MLIVVHSVEVLGTREIAKTRSIQHVDQVTCTSRVPT
jgi:hypothetical protein